MYVQAPSVLSEGPGEWLPLASGDTGIRTTVQRLQKMVSASLTDPATKAAAVSVSRGVRPTDTAGYIKAVWDGVRHYMRYVPDTRGIEEITSPALHSRRILADGQSWGDCDDFSVLGAAWLMSLGVPARFRVLASPKNCGRFDHIRVEAQNAGGWIPLETTMRSLDLGDSVKALRSQTFNVLED